MLFRCQDDVERPTMDRIPHRITDSAQNVSCAELEDPFIATLIFPFPQKPGPFLVLLEGSCLGSPCR